MLIKILAASALTIGLATAAMAQNSTGGTADTAGSGQSITVDPTTPDTGTTGSITTDGMNSNADRNCPATPQGAQPDATHTSPGTATPSVNDNHCGK
ncbi:MAG: hypothetical protein E5X13_31265 [Mesorhizobium sp.]|nr:MAG: hypothetical protein E5X13_31265 [Mesorhizobium sp.]